MRRSKHRPRITKPKRQKPVNDDAKTVAAKTFHELSIQYGFAFIGLVCLMGLLVANVYFAREDRKAEQESIRRTENMLQTAFEKIAENGTRLVEQTKRSNDINERVAAALEALARKD